MANLKYGAIPEPRPDIVSLTSTALATKQAVEILARQRKPILASAVTYQDLIDLGLITPDQVPRAL